MTQKEIKHIFDYIDWSTFPNGEADKELVGTRFSSDDLEVFYEEYHLSWTRFSYIMNTSKKVTFADFQGKII